jgi:hypothetical protein
VNRSPETLALLALAGIDAGTEAALRHAYQSQDGRYCAVTLDNLQSYIVDLVLHRYLHFPEASAAGFDGHKAIMSPDEVRFNLLSWEEDLTIDLRADALAWQFSA